MTETDGVLLLHGTARSARSLKRIERALRKAGYATLNLDYPARKAALGTIVGLIAPEVAAFAQDVARLHIVTHSMGGLVARALITRQRPKNLGRVVMLAPPNGGSEVADALQDFGAFRRFFGPSGRQLATRRSAGLTRLLGPVDYPLGIIAADISLHPVESWLWLKGQNDGRVSVARTKLEGMSDHLTLHVTHAMMMWNPRVIGETLAFLRDGRFARGFTDRPLPAEGELF